MRSITDGLGETGVVDQIIEEWSTCFDPKRAAEIAVELSEERLVHQGSPSNAALAAVPKLFGLLFASAPKNKEDLLLVLARIAVGSPERYWNFHGQSENLTRLARRRDIQGSCYRAVAKGDDKIIRCLENRRPLVRAAAALILGLFSLSESKRMAISDKLRYEKDERVRCALYLCLAVWELAFGKRPASELAFFLEYKPLAIFGRAVVRTRRSDLRDEASRRTLMQAVTDPPEGFDARKNLPLDIQRIAFEALKVGWPATVRKVAIKGVRSGIFDPAEAVELIFPLPLAPPAVWADLPVPGELAPETVKDLRELGRAMGKKSGSWIPLPLAKATGLPSNVSDFRRWLGLDPAGPWENLLFGIVNGKRKSWPAYRWFRWAATGRLTSKKLLGVLKSIRDSDRLLELLLLSTGADYDLFYLGKWTWVESVQCGLDALRGRSGLLEIIKPKAANEKNNLWRALLLVRSLQLALKSLGKALPEWADPAVRIACENRDPLRKIAREVLVSLQPARRDAILSALELPSKIELRPSMWSRRVPSDAKGWGYLDLAGDKAAAAERAVKAISLWAPITSPSYRLPSDEAVAVLKSLGKICMPFINASMSIATDTGKETLRSALKMLNQQKSQLSKART